MISLIYLTETNFFLGTSILFWSSTDVGRIVLLVLRLGLAWSGLFVNWGVGRYLLLASAFLCLGEYLGLRTLKRSRTPAQVVLMFLLAHVSIVSFLFDLPGLFIGSRASLVVICLNIIAFIYLLCAIIFALDYNTAWGCYGLHTKIKELDGGLCSVPSSLTDGDYTSLNHFPLHCSKAFDGGPDADQILADCLNPPPYTCATTLHVVAHILTISGGIFLGRIPTKYDRLVMLYNRHLNI